jgi:hypothetical protein
MSDLRPPPGKPVEWAAKANGRYYDWEHIVGIEIAKKRAAGIVVVAQSFYYARIEACRELQLAPEHIDIEMKEEQCQRSATSNGTSAPGRERSSTTPTTSSTSTPSKDST